MVRGLRERGHWGFRRLAAEGLRRAGGCASGRRLLGVANVCRRRTGFGGGHPPLLWTETRSAGRGRARHSLRALPLQLCWKRAGAFLRTNKSSPPPASTFSRSERGFEFIEYVHYPSASEKRSTGILFFDISKKVMFMTLH